MSEISSQSTDRLPSDTSKYTYREIARGSFTITPVAQSTGFQLTTNVNLGNINTNNLLPEVEIWMDISGGGTTQFQKAPFTSISSTGAVSRSVRYDVFNNLAKGGGYTLGIACTLYDSSAATTRTFYYKVLSAEAGPGVTGSWLA